VARRRKRTPMLRGALALWAVALAGGLAITIWHAAGWTLTTVVLASAAYVIGRRSGKTPRRPVTRPRAAGQALPGSTAYPPAAPVVSGPSVAAVRSEVISGLRGLGWSARDARSAASESVTATLSDPGRTLTTETVLRAALASANRSQAIRPGDDAPGQ